MNACNYFGSIQAEIKNPFSYADMVICFLKQAASLYLFFSLSQGKAELSVCPIPLRAHNIVVNLVSSKFHNFLT